MFFVYILVCLDSRRSYVGQTDDLLRRYRMHLEGTTRTTRERMARPVVVHWESFGTRAEAMGRERYYKNGAGHRRKGDLVTAGLELFAAAG